MIPLLIRGVFFLIPQNEVYWSCIPVLYSTTLCTQTITGYYKDVNLSLTGII